MRNTPPGVGADLSCLYPDIANYTYSHYQIWHSYHRIHILLILKSMPSFHCMHVSHNHIYISDSPNPYICIIAHAFPHYQIRIFVPHFVGVYVYVGAINRSPTAADSLPITLRTLCKHSTYTHEMGCEHSARRRGPIHRARILTLPIAHIRITKYAFPLPISCVFTYMRAR